MNKFKLIEKAKNTVGTTYALAKDEKEAFGVWVLSANYAGHVKGGIAYNWRYCIKDVDESTARAVFAKKLKGKAK